MRRLGGAVVIMVELQRLALMEDVSTWMDDVPKEVSGD